jgi:hypothetical protein
MAMGLFDDMITETPTETAEVPATENTSETSTNSNENTEEARETVTVASLDELPDGYADVRTFAFELTKANLAKANEEGRAFGPDDMVDTQAVYAATRGKRWSLPALDAVTEDGTKLGLVIPLEAGLAAWNERPERGTGTAAGMTPERRATRILRAGKAFEQLKYWEARVKRYKELLAEVNATEEDAKAAFEAWTETEEGKKAITDDKDSNGE